MGIYEKGVCFYEATSGLGAGASLSSLKAGVLVIPKALLILFLRRYQKEEISLAVFSDSSKVLFI